MSYSIKWFDSVDLFDMIAVWQNREIPLLKPADEVRRKRWASVLANVTVNLLDTNDDLHVFALDGESAAAARFYAALRGGMYQGQKNKKMRLGARCVCFAIGEELTPSRLRMLSVELNLPSDVLLGLAVARDLPGLMFLAIKMALVASKWKTSVASYVTVLDELNDRATVWTPENSMPNEMSFDAGVFSLFDESLNDRVLILHAHGEGSHANLRSLVLCGARPGIENNVNGPVSGGCGVGTKCKRVQNPLINIRGFEELPMQNVVLLSCNGLSVSQSIYPSSASAVLSMVEGTVSQVICNDRPVPLSKQDVELGAAYIANGASMHDLKSLLNERERLRSGVMPWFLIGEPFEGRIRDHIDVIEAPNPLGIVRPVGYEFGWRGSKQLAFFKANGTDNGFMNVQAEVDAARVMVERGLRRCAEAAGIEAGLSRAFLSERNKSDRWNTATDCLKEARVIAERAFMTLLAACEDSVKSGIMADTFTLSSKNAALSASFWDSQAVSHLAQLLFRGAAEVILLTGFISIDELTESSFFCNRCGEPVSRARYRSAIDHKHIRVLENCGVCGVLGVYSEGQIPLTVKVPDRIQPGETYTIPIEVNATDWLSPNSSGALIYELRDKATGLPLSHGTVRTQRGLTELEDLVPSTASPDLHTLRLLLIEGMHITYRRYRIACIPS